MHTNQLYKTCLVEMIRTCWFLKQFCLKVKYKLRISSSRWDLKIEGCTLNKMWQIPACGENLPQALSSSWTRHFSRFARNSDLVRFRGLAGRRKKIDGDQRLEFVIRFTCSPNFALWARDLWNLLSCSLRGNGEFEIRTTIQGKTWGVARFFVTFTER